nr:zinc finger, CCHC-type [Tanacetum cinerariifolium]
MASSITRFDIEIFDENNDFGLWQIKMHTLMVHQGCDVALEALTADMKAGEKAALMKKAYITLILCLGVRMIWGRCTLLYEPEYETELTLDLANIDIETEDEDQALMLFTLLPSSYENVVETLLYGRESLTMEDVLATINSRELKKRTKCTKEETGGGTSKLKCFIFHSEDHVKRDCPMKKSGFVKKGKHDQVSDSSDDEGNTYFEEVLVVVGNDKMTELGAQKNREDEVFQVSNNDAAVAQRWLEEKQLEEKTNTDCLVKEQEKIHLGIKVGVNITVTGVPGQEGAKAYGFAYFYSLVLIESMFRESLSEAWTRFKDLLLKVPYHGIKYWLQTQIFYDRIDEALKETIDYAADSRLRKLSAEKAWSTIKKLDKYEDEGWNDSVIPKKGALTTKILTLSSYMESCNIRYDPEHFGVKFRLGGEQREISLLELGWRVGLYIERKSKENATLSRLIRAETVKKIRLLMEFWPSIREGGFNVANIKVASIRDPKVKLAHRCIATTISCRKESTNRVTEIDLYYLYCIYTEGFVCNIPYWFAKFLTNEIRDALSVESLPYVFKKNSFIVIGVIMELHNEGCVWPATRAVEEDTEAEEEAEGEAANEGARGSAEMYQNISKYDWKVRQARWMDQQDEHWEQFDAWRGQQEALYFIRRSLEVLRKFHCMILEGRFNQLSYASSPSLSKPQVPSPIEDYSDIGSPEVNGPPSPDYVPGPKEPDQAPLSPDYVPGLEEPEQAPPSPVYLPYVPELVYPEYMPPEVDVFPAEEQPLPVAATPTADSPRYILKFDPKGDPEEDDEEDPEEDPADYHVDSIVVALPAVDHVPSEEVTEPLLQIPYPPLPIPSSPPNSLTHIEIPESCLPLRKRLRFASLTPSQEVGESSAARAARQDEPVVARDGHYSLVREEIYGFVDRVDVAPGRPMSMELDYEITDTWDDLIGAIEEIAPTTLQGVNQRVTNIYTVVE